MSESNEIQEKDENASNANGVEISQFIEKDELFDPTVEMLVNAFDDERTLDEEENIAAIEAEDPDVELLDLQKVIFQFCLQFSTSYIAGVESRNSEPRLFADFIYKKYKFLEKTSTLDI